MNLLKKAGLFVIPDPPLLWSLHPSLNLQVSAPDMAAHHQQQGPIKLRDVIEEGRVIMRRSLNQRTTSATEDRRFRELFGCGPRVALIV